MLDEQVTLVSSDCNRFEVPREVAEMADTVKNLLAEMADDEATVPLMNVRGEILAKVIEYCKFHVEAKAPNADTNKPAKSEDDIQSWDKDFIKVDKSILFELILAANYLNIKDLLDLTCQAVADIIKGKTPEEIRKEFNIENDFSPAEEEEVRRENQWAFD